MEMQVAEHADVIVHTNYAIYNDWVERYGEDIKRKMRVMPLVFNNKFNVDSNGKKTKNKYVISHIGTLYLNRNSVDFLKALKIMFDDHPNLKDSIELNYVGTVTNEDKNAVEKLGLSDITFFRGFLSEQECKPYFEDADLFLAVDGKDASTIFFPSKIMKYFFFQKPILGLTPEGSSLEYELKQSQNYCFRNDDHQGISECLYNLVSSRNECSIHDKEYWRKFTMGKIEPEYEKMIMQLLSIKK